MAWQHCSGPMEQQIPFPYSLILGDALSDKRKGQERNMSEMPIMHESGTGPSVLLLMQS